MSAVTEEISDSTVETREMTENVEHKRSLRVLSRFHDVSDGVLSLANQVTLSNSKHLEQDGGDLSLTLQCIARCDLSLLLRKFRAFSNTLRLNLVRHAREAL